ncbi:MAG: ankyrin repeat domain-containing protein, partial [Leptospiraceae bacterium]|nr:ankyrin repeat domain-containing protein [Leptospiraceae bacterium]
MNRELINIKGTHEKVEFESILNVHGKNEEGQTPLHMAATRGHIELVASLIER